MTEKNPLPVCYGSIEYLLYDFFNHLVYQLILYRTQLLIGIIFTASRELLSVHILCRVRAVDKIHSNRHTQFHHTGITVRTDSFVQRIIIGYLPRQLQVTSTLYVWMGKYPEISEAATRGRAGAREQILNSLYKKATGFSVMVKVPMRRRTLDGDDKIEIVEKEEYFPPDERAARLWLNADERRRLRDDKDDAPGGGTPVRVIVDV